MRLTVVAAGLVACWTVPAVAQQAADSESSTATPQPISLVQPTRDPRPLSPSTGTSDVSPSVVPQSMERMEPAQSVAELSLGSLYASGDYGTDSTTSIWTTALGARLRLGGLRFTASLPYMRIRSRSTVFTGIDSTPVLVAPDTSLEKKTTRGFGDLTLGASYTIDPSGSAYELELSGRAKIATATADSRLSSGANDYAFGAELSRTAGRFGPFVSATYRFLGDSAAYQLRDGFAASAGTSFSIGRSAFVLASYR